MADIVQGLFGVSPESMKAQHDAQFQQQNLQLAQLGPEAQRFAMLGSGGRALGQAVGGMFGAQDPAMYKQAQENQLLQDVQSGMSPEDMADPVKLNQAIYEAASKANMPELASHAYSNIQTSKALAISQGKDVASTVKSYAEAEKAVKEQLDPFARQLLAAGYTKDSEEYKQAMSDKIKKDTNIPDNTKRSTYAQILLDSGLVEGSPEFKTEMLKFAKSELEGKKKGSGNVVIGGISIDTGKLSEAAGTAIGKDAAAIEESYGMVGDLKKARNMLTDGIFAGPYGPKEMDIAKFSRQNLKKVANTQKFKSYVANVVIKRLKDIGGNDTEEERNYLEAMVGGDISQELPAIQSAIDSAESKIQAKIDRTKLQVESAGKKQPMPLNPLKPNRRFNTATGQFEVIK